MTIETAALILATAMAAAGALCLAFLLATGARIVRTDWTAYDTTEEPGL